MANNNFERMITLGEWLQRLFDPKVKSWTYRDLAQQFIHFYNMDFELSQEDISIKFIELLENCEDRQKDSYIKSMDMIYNLPKQDFKIFIDSETTKKQKFDLLFSNQNDEGSKILSLLINSFYFENEDAKLDMQNLTLERIEYCLQKLSMIVEIRHSAKALLKSILNIDQPWDQVFPETKNAELYYGSGLDNKSLFHGYNGLIEELRLYKNRIVKKTTFRREYAHSFANDLSNPSLFPWEVAVSRSVFDFLFLGGQDYYLFCEHCGRFTAAQRKGRKRFCSDICRTQYGIKKRLSQ